jgi:hypothetical protein
MRRRGHPSNRRVPPLAALCGDPNKKGGHPSNRRVPPPSLSACVGGSQPRWGATLRFCLWSFRVVSQQQQGACGDAGISGTSAEPASAELRLRVQLRVLQALRLLCVQLRVLQALHLLRVQLRVLQAACVLRFQLRVLQAIRVFRVQSAPFRRSAYSASSCASCRRSARTGAGECLSPDLTRTGDTTTSGSGSGQNKQEYVPLTSCASSVRATVGNRPFSMLRMLWVPWGRRRGDFISGLF